MKKLLFILFAALTLVVSGCKVDEPGILVSKIPDPIFRAYLLENFDTDNDGEISTAEALKVTSIDVSKSEIKSLEGIQYFTNLTYLNCYGNQLTTLDVSKNTALTHLYCQINQLTTLDVSKNTALTELWCGSNQLTTLDVSQNTALAILYCSDNQLITLDVSKTNLNGGILTCNMSTLETLYLKTGWVIEGINSNRNSNYIDPNTKILYDEISMDQIPGPIFRAYLLENFDTDKDGEISPAEALTVTYIYVEKSGTKSLEGIQYFTNLIYLDCSENQISTLDVSKNTKLKRLWCKDNQLTTLDVSKNTELNNLQCDNNQLTALDVSKNTALMSLGCDSNQLTALDVSKNTSLTGLWCNGNQLTALDVSKNTELTYLDCSGNQLTTLDLSKNTKLQILDCNENQLTTLDVSKTNLNRQILWCKMSTLETLYLKTGWVIEGINSNRDSDNIDPNTEILYKD